MNDRSKGILLNSSSLIDLKAEVLKKRQLLTQAKLLRNQSESSGFEIPLRRTGGSKLKKIYEENVDRKTKKVPVTPGATEICDRAEEENVLRNSRLALERKAQLYDKITSGKHIPDEEEGVLYLVNFEKKIVDNILQKKAEKESEDVPVVVCDKPEPREEISLDDIPLPAEPENKWIEYLDNMGRQKCCLKKDLPYFSNIDNVGLSEKKTPNLQEEEEDDAEATSHYQKLKDDEIRLHGVGYFSFSRKHEEREKQMEVLNKLREQTIIQRENRVKLKEKRKALLKERLSKIKKRKQITTDDPQDSNSEDSDEPGNEEPVPPLEATVEEVKESEKDLKRKLHIRPWDKDKNLTEVSRPGFLSHEAKTLASHFKWIEDRRNERQEEFAPPNFYSKH